MANVEIERNGKIVVLRLNKPPANAITTDLAHEVADRLDELKSDGSVAALIVTGQGNAFCAGLDLKVVPSLGISEQHALLFALNRLFGTLYGFPRPVVAAINGHAIAGGLILALCCDYRIVVAGPYRFGVTEVKVGVPYPVAAIEVACREMRTEVARNLILFGDTIDSGNALMAGIVDEVLDATQLPERAMAAAEKFAALPPTGFRQIKAQLRRSALERIGRAIQNREEPLLDGWLTDETVAAAHAVLTRGRG